MIGNLNKKDIIALVYITLLSIIAVGYGFSIIPSPMSEQAFATDQKRVEDLSNIQTAVDAYYQNNDKLPISLTSITTQAYDPSMPLEKKDPQTNQPYVYQVTSSYSYELCATFTTDSSKEQPDQYDNTGVYYPITNGSYTHPAGYFCFTEREQPKYNPPSSYPPVYPIFPCRAGRMCPLKSTGQSTPTIYNNGTSSSKNRGTAG